MKSGENVMIGAPLMRGYIRRREAPKGRGWKTKGKNLVKKKDNEEKERMRVSN